MPKTSLDDLSRAARSLARERAWADARELDERARRGGGDRDALVGSSAALRRRLSRADTRASRVLDGLLRLGAPPSIVRHALEPWTREGTRYRRDLDRVLELWLDSPVGPVAPVNDDAVHLESTPVSVVFDLVDRVPWRAGDRFVDLGGGLGQVSLLIRLMTGSSCRSVELDADVAARAARRVGPFGVDVVHADAKDAVDGWGRVVYLFTPFRGRTLEVVIDRLRRLAPPDLVVATYGEVSRRFVHEPWLAGPVDIDPFRLALWTRSGAGFGRAEPTERQAPPERRPAP